MGLPTLESSLGLLVQILAGEVERLCFCQRLHAHILQSLFIPTIQHVYHTRPMLTLADGCGTKVGYVMSGMGLATN